MSVRPGGTGAPVGTSGVLRWEIAGSLDLVAQGSDTVVATYPHGRLTWHQLSPGVRDALLTLGRGPVEWTELARPVAGKPEELGRLVRELNRLLARQLLEVRCADEDGDLLVLRSVGRLAALDLPLREPAWPVRLSRFAALRRGDDGLVVESPLRYFRLTVTRPAVAGLIAAATQPVDAAAAAIQLADPVTRDAVLHILSAAGVLVPADGSAAEDADPVLRQRSQDDVLFHAASRPGLRPEPAGGTFRFDGALPPPPALRPGEPGPVIRLPPVEPGPRAVSAPSLWEVIEARRSIRVHGSTPLSVAQLGEFLYRVARVQQFFPVDRAAGALYEMTRRPYPSGGAEYDLELYLTVSRCTGLDPGMYRHLPAEHALERLPTPASLQERMLQQASAAAGGTAVPQVLITMASRFTRASWKYERIAYALTLKHVGVLYELMYLVATALDLAPCALGTGDSATFSQATGLRVDEESSVGEFMLGSREADNKHETN